MNMKACTTVNIMFLVGNDLHATMSGIVTFFQGHVENNCIFNINRIVSLRYASTTGNK